jgi:prevent-host-death family protein
MIRVGSKELRDRLGRYLKRVRNGETVEVMNRGRAVARLVPATTACGRDSQTLAGLAAQGLVSMGSGVFQPHKPAVLKRGRSITEMLRDDRR